MEHLGCGGTLVEAIVPYCGKCGRSKASVLRENDAYKAKAAPAPATKSHAKKEEPKSQLVVTNPKRSNKISFTSSDSFSGKKASLTAEPDHSPIISKESAAGNALFDEVTQLRYSAAGRRGEKPVWIQVKDVIQKVMQIARNEGDVFLFNQARAVLAEAEQKLTTRRSTTTTETTWRGHLGELGDDEERAERDSGAPTREAEDAGREDEGG